MDYNFYCFPNYTHVSMLLTKLMFNQMAVLVFYIDTCSYVDENAIVDFIVFNLQHCTDLAFTLYTKDRNLKAECIDIIVHCLLLFV